jgi:hypothetical protein
MFSHAATGVRELSASVCVTNGLIGALGRRRVLFQGIGLSTILHFVRLSTARIGQSLSPLEG